jgi:threonyl-tRNA synthetase
MMLLHVKRQPPTLRVKMAAEAAPQGDPFAAAVAERKPYYEKRIALFEQFQQRQKADVEAARAAAVPITITLPDGKQKQGIKGVTTPMEVAKEISSSLAKKVVVADMDGKPWDLLRPLPADCALKLFSFDDPEGKDVGTQTVIHSKLSLPSFSCCRVYQLKQSVDLG